MHVGNYIIIKISHETTIQTLIINKFPFFISVKIHNKKYQNTKVLCVNSCVKECKGLTNVNNPTNYKL